MYSVGELSCKAGETYLEAGRRRRDGGMAGWCYFLLLCFRLGVPLVFLLSALFFFTFMGSFVFSDLSLSLSTVFALSSSVLSVFLCVRLFKRWCNPRQGWCLCVGWPTLLSVSVFSSSPVFFSAFFLCLFVFGPGSLLLFSAFRQNFFFIKLMLI